MGDLPPKFGRVDAGLHLELLHAVDRGQERIRVEVHILIDDAVERVLVVFAALAGNREILAGAVASLPAGGSPSGAARIVRTHIRAEGHQADEVAPIERQLEDLSIRDDGPDGRIRGIDHRSGAGDLDRHFHGAKRQGEIQTGRLLDLQLNSVGNLRLKALQLRSDVVDTGEQRREHVTTRRVALDRARRVGLRVRDCDRSPWQYSAAGVRHHAGDLPERLGRRWDCRKHQAETQDPGECLTHGISPSEVHRNGVTLISRVRACQPGNRKSRSSQVQATPPDPIRCLMKTGGRSK